MIGFEHRKSVISKLSNEEGGFQNVEFHVDVEKSSSTAAYEYFSSKLVDMRTNDVSTPYLSFSWMLFLNLGCWIQFDNIAYGSIY